MLSPLSDADIRQVAPSVFATERFPATTSARYQFISTAQVVAAMRNEGFVPVRARQSRSRMAERRLFTRHEVVFRLPRDLEHRLHAVSPEIVLHNSHDGGGAYRVHAGLFRLVCLNGMVVADGSLLSFRVPHSGNGIQEQVIRAGHALLEGMPSVLAQVETWRSQEMTEGQRLEFAQHALGLRFGPQSPLTPAQILSPRRAADTANDLFTVFNRVQEHLLTGGLAYHAADGKQRTTRPLRALDRSTRLNLDLWQLTTDYSYSLN
jgi:hypothetical protein